MAGQETVKPEAPTQPEPDKINVDRNTFINMSLLQFDQDIAFAELKVSELKHKRSEFLLNQNLEAIKEQQQQQQMQMQMKQSSSEATTEAK